jgi:hypothetical protein
MNNLNDYGLRSLLWGIVEKVEKRPSFRALSPVPETRQVLVLKCYLRRGSLARRTISVAGLDPLTRRVWESSH